MAYVRHSHFEFSEHCIPHVLFNEVYFDFFSRNFCNIQVQYLKCLMLSQAGKHCNKVGVIEVEACKLELAQFGTTLAQQWLEYASIGLNFGQIEVQTGQVDTIRQLLQQSEYFCFTITQVCNHKVPQLGQLILIEHIFGVWVQKRLDLEDLYHWEERCCFDGEIAVVYLQCLEARE